MKINKILPYILSLALLAAIPAQGQIIPRSGGGGGGGGGGDASAANQATQITALPLEDAPHTTGDRGSFSLGVIHTGLGNVGAIGDYSQFSTDLAGRQYNIPMVTANTAIATQLGKLEDATAASGDAGVAALGVARSGVSPQVGANDDYVNPSHTREGVAMNLLVHSTLIGSGARLSDADDGQFIGTTPGLKTLVVRDDVLEADAGVGADLDFTLPRVDNFGSGWSALTADDGARIPADSTTGLLVNVSAVTPGVAISNLGAQEDAVASNVKVGVAAMTVRDDVLIAGAGVSADNDFTFLRVNNFGGLWLAHSGAAFFAITDTAIAAVSQNFAFGFTSKKVFISAPTTNSDGVCIDHAGGTAICPASDTAGDDVLEPGESISIDEHAITSVSAISVSGTNTIVVRAFN